MLCLCSKYGISSNSYGNLLLFQDPARREGSKMHHPMILLSLRMQSVCWINQEVSLEFLSEFPDSPSADSKKWGRLRQEGLPHMPPLLRGGLGGVFNVCSYKINGFIHIVDYFYFILDCLIFFISLKDLKEPFGCEDYLRAGNNLPRPFIKWFIADSYDVDFIHCLQLSSLRTIQDMK